jgi:hypothetical protein
LFQKVFVSLLFYRRMRGFLLLGRVGSSLSINILLSCFFIKRMNDCTNRGSGFLEVFIIFTQSKSSSISVILVWRRTCALSRRNFPRQAQVLARVLAVLRVRSYFLHSTCTQNTQPALKIVYLPVLNFFSVTLDSYLKVTYISYTEG